MDLTDLEELSGKLYVLENFVRRLRENSANSNNMIFAAAVERILQNGSGDEISQAFKMCEEKFKEV